MSRRWAGMTHGCKGHKVQVLQQQTCLSCLAKASLESISLLAVAPHPRLEHISISGEHATRNTDICSLFYRWALPIVDLNWSIRTNSVPPHLTPLIPPFNIPSASPQYKLLGVICRYHCMLQQSAFLQFRHIPPRTISLLCLH